MIDGYMIRRMMRAYDAALVRDKIVLEGYAYSLGIITSDWDNCDDDESPSMWEAMLEKL